MNKSTGWKFYWYKHTQNTEKNPKEGIYYRIHNITVSDGGQYWCRAGRGNPVYYTDYSDALWINVTDSAASSSSSHGLKVGVAVGLSVIFLIIFLVLLWCYKNKKGKVSESPSGVSPQQNISQTSDQKHNEDGYTPLQSGDAHIYDSVNAADNKDTSTDNVSGAADLTYADIELKPKKEVNKNKEKKDIYSGSNDVTYAQIKLNNQCRKRQQYSNLHVHHSKCLIIFPFNSHMFSVIISSALLIQFIGWRHIYDMYQ